MPALDRRTTGTAGLLVVVLFAYTIQTQLTSYVQHSLGYRKPFFLFYLTHSGYLALLPAHVVALKLGGTSLRTAFRGLRDILAHHFRAPSLLDHDGLPTSPKLSRSDGGAYRVSAPVRLAQLVLPRSWAAELEEDWVAHLARKTLILTVFISAPALSWYAAVPLTSMTDITAIYNVFAFVRCPPRLSNHTADSLDVNSGRTFCRSTTSPRRTPSPRSCATSTSSPSSLPLAASSSLPTATRPAETKRRRTASSATA